MKIIEKIIHRFQKEKVLRYTDDLCEHMSNVYGYFKAANPNYSKGDMIKEAVSTIGTWVRTSDNVFKHKFRGDSIEIKPNSNPIDVTKLILQIEIANLLPGVREGKLNELVAIALAELERYYTVNTLK